MELNPEIIGGEIIALDASPSTTELAPISTRKALAYSSGNVGAGIFFALNNFFLPLLLGNLGASVVLSNLLSSTHSFEGSIIQPIVGASSDRTWTRLGRRLPFVAWFMPITVLFLILTPLFSQLHVLLPGLSPTLALVAVSISIFIFSLAFNIAYDPYLALLADITPIKQRGTVNGIFQAVGAIGQVVFLLIALVLVATIGVGSLFLISAVLLALTFLPTLLGIRERKELVGVTTHRRYTLRDYWNGLRSDPQVLLFFASQFFLWFGINTISVTLTRYAKDGLHFSEGIVFLLPLILLLFSALPVWPPGVLSDRVGLKTIFVFGVACMTAAALLAIVIKDFVPLCFVLALAGIGNAAQTATSYPLLTRIVFADQMGLYTGLNSTITSIAVPLTGVISGLLIDQLGFVALFPYVAAMFILSLLPLIPLSIERSKAVQAMRAATPTASVSATE